ncbi:hypothetical protein VNO77_29524 [Canavalia gladiata]|uniref:Uncharacterized protein n=1 Tax=Canavalia gladiata TaxID=3824 RepID=A0AAN9KXC1_CANGL
MGKWDYRPSRRFFRHRRSPVPTPIFYDDNAPLPEFQQDGIPLWEKKYCTSVGLVPWQKIVDSKKFVYCHCNILDWNDSGAEEAFQSAKKYYWAKINCLPCDITMPDPDTYIDQIDWNPYIDPELVKELDSAFFTLPDEEQENGIKYKRAKTSVDDENPWECAGTPLSRALENNKVQGWNQRDYESVNDIGNPWECSLTHRNGGLTDSAWEGGPVNSWGWNTAKDHSNQCKDWNSGHSKKDKGWDKVRDSSWHQQQSNNLANICNSWQCKSSQQNITPINTGWRNNGANVSGWKQQENADVSNDLQLRRYYRGWTPWNQGYQQRQGFNRHTLGCNSSQFKRDDRQTGHYWGRGKSKKRDFVP